MKYSVIIPVYNRPDEVKELMDSLAVQSFKDFEVLIVEDGSSLPCKEVVEGYKGRIEYQYFFKENSGPGESRNYGMERAKGDYLVFFDSDCIIPPQYFSEVETSLKENKLDCWGGPDAAHDSFSDIQKAINFAMTSTLTTGGIRGKKKQLDKTYQPRSFNMGFSKEVYENIGGFTDLHPGEDPDLSYRILGTNYKVGLIEKAFVYHKRRIDFQKFSKQVYKFGVVRNVLFKWYPDSIKLVYFLPLTFLKTSVVLVLASLLVHSFFLLPLLLFAFLLLVEALFKTKSLKIALLAVFASFVQLYVYGYGFAIGFLHLFLLQRDEREALPSFFFKK